MSLLINCDIGERGENALDEEILSFVDIANIACGGHAGDENSVNFFFKICQQKNVISCLHLSYPDKQNFGRRPFDISWRELVKSLNYQRQFLPQSCYLKFHGQLYNDANNKVELAKNLSDWIMQNNISTVITDSAGYLAQNLQGLKILGEVFVDRCYIYQDNLQLMPRSQSGAIISTLEEAITQLNYFLKYQKVLALNKINQWQDYLLDAQTICIHSDNPIALELAQAIHKILKK